MPVLEYFRIKTKSSTGLPTNPPSNFHDTGDWSPTDIYEFELYVDDATGILYTRRGGTIVQLSVPGALGVIGTSGGVQGDGSPGNFIRLNLSTDPSQIATIVAQQLLVSLPNVVAANTLGSNKRNLTVQIDAKGRVISLTDQNIYRGNCVTQTADQTSSLLGYTDLPGVINIPVTNGEVFEFELTGTYTASGTGVGLNLRSRFTSGNGTTRGMMFGHMRQNGSTLHQGTRIATAASGSNVDLTFSATTSDAGENFINVRGIIDARNATTAGTFTVSFATSFILTSVAIKVGTIFRHSSGPLPI